MASSGVTLDRVSIEIKASASDANQNISQLTQTLSELRSATKGGFNNLSKLAQSLSELKSASSNLSEVATNIQSLTTISDAFKQLEQISNPKGLEKALENLEKLPSVFDKITPKSLENVTRVSTSLAEALSPLADKLGLISQGFSSVSQLADKYGISVTKIREYTKQTTNYTKNLSSTMRAFTNGLKSIQKQNENFFKSLSKGASSIISKVKQIGLSLLGTRTIFTATRKAVSEYMAMDAELTWYITNNWRALGAQLAPAIEYVAWLFKQFVRVVYSVILALTGIDLIARANEKAMRGWGKAAKDTLGNLQRFDDLNVVEFPKGSGGGDDNKLIELDTIDLTPIQKIIDWVRKMRDEIKAAWESGEWYGVGEVLAEGFNGAIKFIKFDILSKKLKNVAKKFGDFLRGYVENIRWDDLGTFLTDLLSLVPNTLTEFINNIPWDTIGKGIGTMINSFRLDSVFHSILSSINALLLGTQELLINLDWGAIGRNLSDTMIGIFKDFNDLLSKIEWTKLFDGLRDAITNINFADIGESIANTINTFFSTFDFSGLAQALSEFAHNLFKGISTFIATVDWEKIGRSIITFILDVDWARLSVDLLQFCQDLWDGLLDAARGAGKSLGEFIFSFFEGDTDADARSFGEKISDGIALGMFEKTREHIKQNGLIGETLGFIKGFIKGFFDIHSPSKWAETEIGENIVLGIASPFTSLWDKIKGSLSSFASNLSSYFDTSNFVSLGSNIVGGIKSGLSTVGSTLSNVFKPAFNGVVEMLNKVIGGVNNKLSISIGSSLSSILDALGVKLSKGKYQLFSIPTLSKLETGTNEIPYEGIYHLHPGEAVVPKKYNPALGGGTNEETNRRLDTLIDTIENQEHTTNVYIGNDKVYKGQKKYNTRQVNKYGTIRVS